MSDFFTDTWRNVNMKYRVFVKKAHDSRAHIQSGL